MPHAFTRQQLYDLVWKEPMRTLATQYGLSDVGLAKACRRAEIPVPPRGYWAKRHAGRKAFRIPLPVRGLGMANEITAGGNQWSHRYLSEQEALSMVIPPPPVFEESMESVIERVRKLARKARIPRSLTPPHRHIARLLEEDEVRRQKQLASKYNWDHPVFDSVFERRRLKILNGIFTGIEQCGMRMRPR